MSSSSQEGYRLPSTSGKVGFFPLEEKKSNQLGCKYRITTSQLCKRQQITRLGQQRGVTHYNLSSSWHENPRCYFFLFSPPFGLTIETMMQFVEQLFGHAICIWQMKQGVVTHTLASTNHIFFSSSPLFFESAADSNLGTCHSGRRNLLFMHCQRLSNISAASVKQE